MQAQPYCTFFLFINDSSGGGVGEKLLMQEIEKLEFNFQVGYENEAKLIHVYLFNMLTKREKGFSLLKKATDAGKNVIAIICGGDGTIMWVVSQMNRFNINPMKVPLGVIPLGTGNDFSQYLGWGKEKTTLVENGFRSLKKLIRKWLVAKQEPFDLWKVKAQIYDNGKFEKVSKTGQNILMTDEKQNKKFRIQYNFCNYFSFGIDGKIGYSFDKRRTKSRMMNLMVYGIMGMVKAATPTKTIKELVDTMETAEPGLGQEYIEPEPTLQNPHNNIKNMHQTSEVKMKRKQQQGLNESQTNSRIVFKSKIKQENNQSLKDACLKDDYYNFLVLNINSFMGGVTNIWENAKDKELHNPKEQYGEISTSDGKVEIVCFGSSVGMAMERMIGGFASKIAQGCGPYNISFNQYPETQKHRTYLQIDGEFIRYTHPKSIWIGKSDLGNNGKIKVLKRNLQAEEGLKL